MVQLSILEGHFPQGFTKGMIVLLHKGGERVAGKCMVRCLTMCDKVQFSEMMCIRRSFLKKLLHFFMPFEL
jgi:hypothetical protein